MTPSYTNWQDLIQAKRSAFFKGHTQDTVHDQSSKGQLAPSSESLFTQSNARVLVGHAANGMFRIIALPTQVYPAPTQTSEFGLGPGMYHHFDVVMYAGNLTYQIALDNGGLIDIGAEDRQSETVYADHFIPLTTNQAGDLEITTVSFAPVAPDASKAALSPAPLPGPAGAFYVLIMKNTGNKPYSGTINLKADDLLVGHYEDASPELRAVNRPALHLRQHTLILSRPEGCVGIHLCDGNWNIQAVPYTAQRGFTLAPGEERIFETHIAMSASYNDIMPTIYALHMRSALDWLNLTASYWHSRLGNLNVESAHADAGKFSQDLYFRILFDNFNCLQTDADGNLIAHWQGAPSHGYGTVWGIDVEPTAVSVVNLCPEIARQTMLFFLNRSQAPKGAPDHSVPILVAPIIIARQWLQVTGDTACMHANPDILAGLLRITDQLLSLKAPGETLFPSRYSSDGAVGRRYDYGTNVKVAYAFESMAYIMQQLGYHSKVIPYRQNSKEIRDAITRHMMAEGPLGRQITGGTNLGEDPGGFYLPEGIFYYDGEDTSSMLAPLYDVCDQSDIAWGNYHRFARSLWSPSFDPEFEGLLWTPGEPVILDGTGYFSRLGGSITRQEMEESLSVLREFAVDEVTGSVFWWPHGLEYKRSLTRCSQGQGAWAWQYMEQWLGLKIDAATHTIIFAPRGLLSSIHWKGYKAGAFTFDISWDENAAQSAVRVKNHNETPWTLQAGFRAYGAGAEGPLRWQSGELLPGAEMTLRQNPVMNDSKTGITAAELVSLEVQSFGENGFLFKRYGPAQLWGHWDADKLWDMAAMPLAMRFVILNDTGADWTNVQVTLQCPAGWTAQGRRPKHWDRAEHLLPDDVTLELGDLPATSRTVAPFWVKEPESIKISMVWWNESIGPFHQPSQPDDGIHLFTANPDGDVTVTFTAILSALTHEGRRIEKTLEVPIRITPVNAS